MREENGHIHLILSEPLQIKEIHKQNYEIVFLMKEMLKIYCSKNYNENVKNLIKVKGIL